MKNTTRGGRSPHQPRAEDRERKDGEEPARVQCDAIPEEFRREPVQGEQGEEMTQRHESSADHGIPRDGERNRQQIEVEGTEISLGPADAGPQQRKARAGGNGRRRRDVAHVIEEEPRQVEAVEAHDGADGDDRSENQPSMSIHHRARRSVT